MLLVSCVGSNDGSTVTQGSYEVTITQPSLNGAPLGASAIVAGDCGIANYPISITGDVTLYSVCQADKTWAAPIPSEGFSPGQTIAVNVQLTSPDGGTTSPVVTRTFVKSNVTCDSLDNLTKLFANIDEGPDGNTTPYIICSPSQLANIALYPDKKFKLGQDIDFNYASFEPIAIPFSGELDGDGFRLDNLVVNKASDTAVGIFKTIISGATVKNIKIKNAVVTGNERVGIITGDWRGIGLVDNVTVTGTVNAVQMAGGLIGLGNTDSQLTITNSKVDVDVAANDFAGGLISYVFSSNKAMLLNNNEVYATVSGNDYVGGVIGRLWDSNAQINNTKHKGDITALGRYVGGVVGESYHAVSMDGASHIGSISVIRNATNGDMNVGGLIGVTRANTTIANSHVVSNITMGGDYAGGLVGRFFGGSISNSYVRGTLTVNDDYYNAVTRFVGGLAGNLNNNT
ncbi:MAG: hypothetical protein N4A33_02415, partial [Bacteriovoracaceae bacterium]|nr:hypothetical protein [Bacteriovoracaceae bacterium]